MHSVHMSNTPSQGLTFPKIAIPKIAISKVSIRVHIHQTFIPRAIEGQDNINRTLLVSQYMLDSQPMFRCIPSMCVAKVWAAYAMSGRVTAAIYWMLPTALMKRLLSDTDAFPWVGSSERLMIFSLGTSGVGEHRQPLMLFLSSRSKIICLCEMDYVFAFLSRFTSIPST